MGHPLDLTFRLEADLQAAQFIRLLESARQEIGFAEDTRFELTVEDQTNQRSEYELAGADLGRQLEAAWPAWRYLVVANQWIKEMNLKFSLVRRTGGVVMVCKGETESADQATGVAEALERAVAELARVQPGALSGNRERALAAAPLGTAVADAVRTPFLAGDFVGALRAAREVCVDQCRRLFPGTGAGLDKLEAAMKAHPPRPLAAGGSGAAARSEWDAFAKVITGTLGWTALHLRPNAQTPATASETLKQLALLSAVAERLEAYEPAEATGRGAARPGKPARPRRPSARPRKKAASSARKRPRPTAAKPARRRR